MTVKAAATRLEVSQSTIYALVAAGKLKAHRIGLGRGCVRISDQQLADYLAAASRPDPPRFRHVSLPKP